MPFTGTIAPLARHNVAVRSEGEFQSEGELEQYANAVTARLREALQPIADRGRGRDPDDVRGELAGAYSRLGLPITDRMLDLMAWSIADPGWQLRHPLRLARVAIVWRLSAWRENRRIERGEHPNVI